MVTYNVIDEQEWEDMAPTAERSASEWDRLLDDLAQGKIISMPYTDLSDRRSKRMTVARRALSRGFKTEVRYTDSIMAISFTLAFLVVLFNLIADVMYGVLDPRIRYD